MTKLLAALAFAAFFFASPVQADDHGHWRHHGPGFGLGLGLGLGALGGFAAGSYYGGYPYYSPYYYSYHPYYPQYNTPTCWDAYYRQYVAC